MLGMTVWYGEGHKGLSRCLVTFHEERLHIWMEKLRNHGWYQDPGNSGIWRKDGWGAVITIEKYGFSEPDGFERFLGAP